MNRLPDFPLVLGTALFGSAQSTPDARAIMDAYWACGGRAFDTAHVYAGWLDGGEGASERCVGQWLADHGLRDQAYIATKGGHPNIKTGAKELHKDELTRHLHESLERLQTDYVDLYYLHRDNTDYPVEEILSWLEDLKSKNLIRHYACSNWTLARIQEASAVANANQWEGFTASSIGYALARTNPGIGDNFEMLYMNDDTHAYHVESGLAQMPYSSQAQGFFSGKYRPDHIPEGKDGVAKTYYNDANFNRLTYTQSLAEAKGATVNQVALAYLLHQPFPVYPVIGARSIEQVQDSCAAAKITLSPDDLTALDRGLALA